MGLAPLHIRSSVRLVTAQRLVRRLCPLCKETVTPTYEQSTRLARSGFPTGKRLSIAQGCEACVHGYLGRIGIFQVLPITKRIGDALTQNADTEAIAAIASAQGLKTLLQSGLQLLEDGITSYDELARHVQL